MKILICRQETGQLENVDRIELENRAKKSFANYLKPDYETVIFKEHTEDWRKADIVVYS